MKINKIIAGLLSAALMASSVPVFAISETEEDKAALLSELNIMQGDPDGNLRLDDNVTRAEFTKAVVAASGARNQVASGLAVSPFRDVTYDYWAAPYIKTAVDAAICKGYPDGTFRPYDNISYEEAVTMVVKLLGYTDADFGASWPYGQIGLANNLDITEHVWHQIGEAINRRDVMNLIYNVLNTDMKDVKQKYLTTFDCIKVEDVTLIASSKEDPSISGSKVLTSNGLYKTSRKFQFTDIGKKGDIVIKDSDEIITFMPDVQTQTSYTVTDTLGSDLILDGKILDFDENLTVYYKSQKLLYQNAGALADEGDTFTVYYNAAGEADYAVLRTGGAGLGEMTSDHLDQYEVDSIVGGQIMIRVDGAKSQLDISDGTTAYDDAAKTTFAAIKTKLAAGDIIYVKRDKNGAVDYVTYKKADGKKPVAVGLERHVVYSSLGNSIVTYLDGRMNRIEIKDNVTAYIDSARTTFGAVKAGLSIGDILYIKRDANQDIEYAEVETGNLQGPETVVSQNWYMTLGISDLSGVTIMRNGEKASTLETNDIVYYSPDLNMALAYSDKITGIYESAYPNKDFPKTITVSGKEYAVEGVQAFDKLSSSGIYKYGDTVTLLLGKDREAADVMQPQEAGDGTVYGYLYETGKKQFEKSDKSQYTAFYVKAVLPNGTECEYVTDKDYKSLKNGIVGIQFQNGAANITRINSDKNNVSGRFVYDELKLGSDRISPNINILDVTATSSIDNGAYTTVFGQRLDGTELNSSDVLFYQKNDKNEITDLILKDVTGDAYQYGIVTKFRNVDNIVSTTGSYTYDIDGTTGTAVTSNMLFHIPVDTPARFDFAGGTLNSMQVLGAQYGIETVTRTYAQKGSRKYLLSDRMTVYEKTADYAYMKIPLDDIIGSTEYKTMTAYLDANTAAGGRVRIMIVSK